MSAAAGPGGKSLETSAGSGSVPVTRLLTLNSDLTNAQVSRLSKEAIYRVTETADPEAVLSLASSSLVTGLGADSSLAPGNGGLSLLQRLREQQVELNVQMDTAATRYGAKSPQMLEFGRQREAFETQIKTELGRIRDRSKSDLDLATEAENSLRARVSTQEGEVSRWTTKADHLLLLQSEAASNRGLYEDLYAKLQESQFATGMRAARVTFVDPARVPSKPASPKKRNDVMLGLVVGLILGVLSALAAELLDGSMHTEQAVRKALRVPVLAVVPRFGKGTGAVQAWIVRDPKSRFAEAYRGFRAAAFAGMPATSAKVLLVASARPAEGKATTCLNTAAVLAAQGHRVIIVNADLRRSRGPETWEESGAGGLTRVLAGELSRAQAVHSLNGVPGVWILPAGPMAPNAPELLASARFGDLLADLREDFDFFFIYRATSVIYTDAKLLAAHADAALLVVSAGQTPRQDANHALTLFEEAGANVVGVLFNGARTPAPVFSKFGYEV